MVPLYIKHFFEVIIYLKRLKNLFIYSIFLIIILSTFLNAARIITSLVLNGSILPITVYSNETITAQVNVTTDNVGGNQWRSTSWVFDAQMPTCVNHSNHNNAGTYNETFTINAPSNEGNYTLTIKAYSNDSCTQGESNIVQRVVNVIPLPNLPGYAKVQCENSNTSDERCKDINLKPNFNLRFGGPGYSVYGDFNVTGASVLGVKSGSSYNWNYTGYLYDSTTAYVKEDTDVQFIQNASKAKLTLPSDITGNKIVYARLYWQGHVKGSGTSYNSQTEYLNAIQDWNKITFKTPDGQIHHLTADINDTNWYGWWGQYGNDGMRFFYQANVDVTNLVKQSYSSSQNIFTAGNVKSTEGKDSATLFLLNDAWISGVYAGFWGGWSLFVVYERDHLVYPDTKLKNIALYDGFDAMTPWTTVPNKNITIDFNGFMTPKVGAIDSKMAFLGFGGEKAIARDYFQISNQSKTIWYDLSNSENSANNTFNDTISYLGSLLDINKRYNPGIDLDTFDVSSYMTNSQSQTSLKLGGTYSGSNADQNFPSMVAFSTQLYVPDMCYEENITKNGEVPTQIYVGDTLDFEVLISNKSDQPASGVVIKRTFNDSLEYERNSTFVKNSSGIFEYKTDAENDDTVKYLEMSNDLSLNLGTGATILSGGSFAKDQNATFRFKFHPQQDGNLTNAYAVSYQDDSNISGTGSINYTNIPIGKCSDRTITSTIIPIEASGKVRIVESGKNWNDNGGRLFTKIVNKPTSYDILFATNDTGTTLTSGEIKKLEILNIENLSSPILVATPINSLTTINQRYPLSLTHTSAYKRLQFRVTLNDDTLALSNDFSVRPADFNGTIDSLWAGESVTVLPGNIKARDNSLNPTMSYNKTLTATNISTLYIDPAKTCLANTKNTLIDDVSILMINGQSSSVTAFFKDIVDNLVVTLKDSDWVGFSDDVINGDCIVGSATNTVNTNGLVGCNIEGNVTITVQPYELNITDANFTASTGQNWLYDANVSDMYVNARATVQANNKQHIALQNFTSSCYAQPVDLTFYYDTNNTNTDVNLSYVITSGTMASTLKSISDINKTITLPASLFTTSSASADYRFNVDRVYNKLLNPIDFALKDVKVTSTTVAKDENNATVNQAKRFYYGRVKTKDIATDKTIAPHSLHVEVYSTTPLSGFYQNSLNWWINASDDGTTTSSDVNLSAYKDFIKTTSSIIVSAINTIGLTDGKLDFSLVKASSSENQATFHLAIPSWLWYSTLKEYDTSIGSTCAQHPCFEYRFLDNATNVGIKSGELKGATIGKDFNSTYQKSGVKTFR